jgi:putative hydroxymethylpyrimidine transport system substrate-binding protein
MTQRRTLLLAGVLAPLVVPAQAQTSATPPAAPTPLTVLLDWFINPDHGPVIVAQEGGFFARAGLEVRIIAPADPSDPPKLVAAGRGDIAVYYQKNLPLAVQNGLPLVRVGTLVSTPLSTLTVLRDGPIKTLADLRGKKIGYSVPGFEEIYVGTMIAPHGLTMRDVTMINVSFGLSSALMSGQVDAIIGGFRNFELNQLAIENRPGRAFYPEENGFPPYDELIYVANRAALGEPKLRRFIDATEAAVQFLVNNPDEAWRMFIAGPRRELDNELNRRAWRDTLNRFSHSPGALDRNRYERFTRFLAARGMIRSAPALDSYAVELAPAS